MSDVAAAPPRIAGFEYVRPLGTGGFAHVYLYEQDMPRRMVAVKVMDAGLMNAQARADFEAEADAMARLSSHPSIVSVWAAGVSADGKPYLAMEYCPDSMRARTRETPATPQAVLDAGVRLAGALETAHRAGVLHRDIKPSNVLIATTGRPALADFGISMLHGEAARASLGAWAFATPDGQPDGSQPGLSQPGQSQPDASLPGAPSGDKAAALSIPWSAPEVIDGATAGTIASEIWALGATLYTFAASRSPFESADRAQNTQLKMSGRIRRARYTPVPGAQGYEPLDELLSTAMHANPERRFSSMREFGEALQRLQRRWGFDVTPLDIIDAGWVAPVAGGPATGAVPGVNPWAAQASPRGPVVTSVRGTSRAQQRAERDAAAPAGAPGRGRSAAERDGLTPEPGRGSGLKAGLIGAGAAVVVLGGLAVLAFSLGWIG